MPQNMEFPTMASQAAHKFAMRLTSVFEPPKDAPDGFVEAIAEACDGYSGEVYDRSFTRLRDTRIYRKLPMPAEAKAICDDQREVLEALKKTPKRPQDSLNGDWSKEAAFDFIRRTAIAKDAAQEGWIGPLVGHVRQFHREPAWNEIPALKKIQREFENTMVIATGQWKPLGEAMARQQSAWAAAVLERQASGVAA